MNNTSNIKKSQQHCFDSSFGLTELFGRGGIDNLPLCTSPLRFRVVLVDPCLITCNDTAQNVIFSLQKVLANCDSSLLRGGTPKHTQTVINATQKETAIDQQQHSCETVICRHQTTLRLLSSAATACTRWRVGKLYCPPTYVGFGCVSRIESRIIMPLYKINSKYNVLKSQHVVLSLCLWDPISQLL